MPTVINGLPAHILLIHVVIVLVPLGALFTVLSAVWPAARRKLGFLSPLTCLIALVFLPLTINAGNWLRAHLHATGDWAARIQKHANLGNAFWPYAVALFVVSAAVWLLGRRFEMAWRPGNDAARSVDTEVVGTSGGTATATRTRPQTRRQALPQWGTATLAVVSIVVSALTVWQLYRTGDAGSQAVWKGLVSS